MIVAHLCRHNIENSIRNNPGPHIWVVHTYFRKSRNNQNPQDNDYMRHLRQNILSHLIRDKGDY